jgi:uncharacterized membrane protein YdjX (TVP38/TMEM64 family)
MATTESSSEHPEALIDEVIDRSALRWLKPVAAAVAALIVAYLLWSAWDHRAVMDWIYRLRPVPFFVAMAVLPAIGFPFTPLFLFAGASFGPVMGFVGSMIALAANLVVCFVIARRMREPLQSLLRRFKYELPDFRGRGRASVRFAFTVKAAPGIPGFVKHYGLGLAGVPFVPYFFVALGVSGAYAAASVIVGNSLFDHDVSRTVVTIAILAGATAVVVWLRRRTARRRALAAARSG